MRFRYYRGYRTCGAGRWPGCRAAAVVAPVRQPPKQSTRTVDPRIKDLPHLTVDHPLLVTAARVAGNHPPPETDSTGIAQVLGDFPAAGEAIEDEIDGRAAHPQPTAVPGDEKLRHAVFNNRRTRRRLVARHHRKSHRLGGLENDQG